MSLLDSSPTGVAMEKSEAAAVDAGASAPAVGRSPVAEWIYGTGAFLIAIGWFAVFHFYWTPAHDGVDQNGYLVGGRMFADHLSTGMTPPDLFGYVGRMWIGTPWMTYYPKYPIGLPILCAGMLKLGELSLGRAIVFAFSSLGWGMLAVAVAVFVGLRSLLQWALPARGRRMATPACLAVAAGVTLAAIRVKAGPFARLPIEGPTAGVELTYLICPVSTMLALVGTYQLVRLVTGSFGAILAMLTVACSPVTLELANNSNSHAPTLFCVTWGMFLLIRWWQSGGAWRAAWAGFLLGYAVTIRYTEGLLVLPLVLALLMRAPWRSRRSLVEAGMLLAWWAIPVMFLAAFNLGAFGALTGYDSTNESTGFSWQYFQANWDTTVQHLYDMGLFFVFAPGIVGIAVMFMQRWRMALLLSSWIVPSLLVYTAYYWAPDNNSVAYLRFYLTIFPALAMGAFYLFCTVTPAAVAAMGKQAWRGRAGVVLAGAIFALLAVGTAAWTMGDVRWQEGHPLSVEQQLALGQRNPRMGRFGGGFWGGVRRPSEAIQKAEGEEDLERLENGAIFAMHRLPAPVGAAVIVLAGLYWAAWWWSGKSSVLGGSAAAGAGVLGGGVVALASCAMSLYVATPDLETQYRQQLAQAEAADVVVDDVRVPAGSVIFSDESMLKNLQFVGDYQLYNIAQFSVTYIRGLEPGRFDPDQPQAQQPERAEMLYRLLHTFTEKDLLAKQKEVVSRAFGEGRRVYVMVSQDQIAEARYYYFPPGQFKTEKLAEWQAPPDLEPRGGQRLAPGLRPGGMLNRVRQQFQPTGPAALEPWMIMEVTPISSPASSVPPRHRRRA